MRKACSTQSTYSPGVRRPTMSLRLRISVLRCRQLSAMRRLYDASARATSALVPAGHVRGTVPRTRPERTVGVADKVLLRTRFLANGAWPEETRPAGRNGQRE